jgi:hypothetical protein
MRPRGYYLAGNRLCVISNGKSSARRLAKLATITEDLENAEYKFDPHDFAR